MSQHQQEEARFAQWFTRFILLIYGLFSLYLAHTVLTHITTQDMLTFALFGGFAVINLLMAVGVNVSAWKNIAVTTQAHV